MNISPDLWIWFSALGMIAIFSSIFKDNPFYRAVEHIYVGAGAGYAISMNYRNIVNNGWNPMVQDGRWILIIPLILGLLLYTRFFRQIAWLSRWSMSFLVGIGAGISMFGIAQSQLVNQVRATMVPLTSINNIIMVLGTIAVLLYFLFSVRQTESLKKASMVGRVIMMVTFGVSFGNVIMGRISLLLGALENIYGNWLGLF